VRIYGTDYTGFVYIWFDRRKTMFYVGSHFGPHDDGYVCSSRGMKNAWAKRPHDFTRRIVSWCSGTHDDLIIEEQRWLNMIDPAELGERYYNQSRRAIIGGCTPEGRLKRSLAQKGKARGPRSLESRMKQSSTTRGRPKPKEWCELMSRIQKGKPKPHGFVSPLSVKNPCPGCGALVTVATLGRYHKNCG
jgi:hypothetical protein